MTIKQPKVHIEHSDLSTRIELPVYTWRCYLFGAGNGVILSTTDEETPNAFHRFMQWLCFGNVWKKILTK